MSNILERVLTQLDTDEQYRKALEATNDEKVKEHIDLTVKAFMKDLAGAMDELLTALENDEEAKRQFIARFKK